MSLTHGISKVKTRLRSSAKHPQLGVTKYKVIDADFVEGITPSDEGSVIVKIRRGSLDLPAPETPAVNVPGSRVVTA